jgi:hypothetical protein
MQAKNNSNKADATVANTTNRQVLTTVHSGRDLAALEASMMPLQCSSLSWQSSHTAHYQCAHIYGAAEPAVSWWPILWDLQPLPKVDTESLYCVAGFYLLHMSLHPMHPWHLLRSMRVVGYSISSGSHQLFSAKLEQFSM